MNIVEPIRDKDKISEVKEILKRNSIRDYMLFLTGINTGLRISDLLKLKVSDIRGKDHILLKETKTSKTNRILINDTLRDAMKTYIKPMQDDEYLFASREGDNKPISSVQAYRVINAATRKAGIKDKIGTHTLRKTFGYHHYQQHKDAILLQDIFNHSSASVTMRYIGINNDLKDNSMKAFAL